MKEFIKQHPAGAKRFPHTRTHGSRRSSVYTHSLTVQVHLRCYATACRGLPARVRRMWPLRRTCLSKQRRANKRGSELPRLCVAPAAHDGLRAAVPLCKWGQRRAFWAVRRLTAFHSCGSPSCCLSSRVPVLWQALIYSHLWIMEAVRKVVGPELKHFIS